MCLPHAQESERVTVNQPSAESVAKQAERRKEQEVAAPQLPAVPKKRCAFHRCAPYLFSLL